MYEEEEYVKDVALFGYVTLSANEREPTKMMISGLIFAGDWFRLLMLGIFPR